MMTFRHWRAVSRIFAAVICGGAILSGGLSVRADDGAMNEGAYGPEPVGGINGPESVVAMTSETITLEMSRKETRVRAMFAFRSSKEGSDAHQTIGFPDTGAAVKESDKRDPNGGATWANHDNTAGPIKGMRTFVNGKEVKSAIEYGFVDTTDDGMWKVSDKKKGMLMAWHTVAVTFPPGEDVVVERRYSVDNGQQIVMLPPKPGKKEDERDTGNAGYFTYIVATGGSWKGPIGSLTLNLKLGKELKMSDLNWKGDRDKGDVVSSPPKGEWETVSDKELRLEWTDFEPRTEKDKRQITVALKPVKLEVE